VVETWLEPKETKVDDLTLEEGKARMLLCARFPKEGHLMMDPKAAKVAEELMKKANLPEMMKKPGEKGPSLDSWIREVQPRPKK
jgi:hypothetical protein